MENKIILKEEIALTIYTFERFSILYTDIELTPMFSKYPRVFSLLKFFVINKGRHLSNEYIEENLWGESEYKDLKNTIKGQVFRLRKTIKKISDEFCNGVLEELIEIRYIDGCYTLDLNGDYYLDYEDFENRTRKLLALNTLEGDVYEEYEYVLGLYSNHLLSNLSFDQWVVPRRNYYKRLFMDLVDGMIKILQYKKDDKRAMGLIEKIMLFDPLEERFHIHFIELLLSQGKKYEALKHYNYINEKISRDLGITSIDAMEVTKEKVLESIYQKEDTNRDLEEALALIFKQKRVDMNTFKRIYSLASRLKGRRKIKCAYMVINLEEQFITKLIRSGENSKNIIDTKARNDLFQGLINSISNSIRKGDVYYFDSFNLSFKAELLLYDILESQWSIVTERLLRKLREEVPELPLKYINIITQEI